MHIKYKGKRKDYVVKKKWMDKEVTFPDAQGRTASVKKEIGDRLIAEDPMCFVEVTKAQADLSKPVQQEDAEDEEDGDTVIGLQEGEEEAEPEGPEEAVAEPEEKPQKPSKPKSKSNKMTRK